MVTFLLTRALPGDPAAYFAGPAATEQAIEEIRHQLGLDRSLPPQFVDYLGQLARGDLGTSLTTGQPVMREFLTRLPASAELTLLGLLLSVAIAIPLGIAAALRPGRRSIIPAASSTPPGYRCQSSLPGYCWSMYSTTSPGRPAPLGRLDIFTPHRRNGPASTDRQPDCRRSRDVPGGAGAIDAASRGAGDLLAGAAGAHHAGLMIAALGSEFIRTARASGLPRSRIVLSTRFATRFADRHDARHGVLVSARRQCAD